MVRVTGVEPAAWPTSGGQAAKRHKLTFRRPLVQVAIQRNKKRQPKLSLFIWSEWKYRACKRKSALTDYLSPVRTLWLIRVTGLEPAASWTPFRSFFSKVNSFTQSQTASNYKQFYITFITLFYVQHIVFPSDSGQPLRSDPRGCFFAASKWTPWESGFVFWIIRFDRPRAVQGNLCRPWSL